MALFPLTGHSLGLGALELKSALNEPLRAEIDITSATEEELSGLEVSLASRADFEVAGAERVPMLSRIKFEVLQRPDGRYYVQLSTEAPIQEPFLHMLLRIEWANGRLVREYTALLDPPSYVAGRPAGIEAPRTAPAPPPAAAPSARIPGSVRTVPSLGAGGESGSSSHPPCAAAPYAGRSAQPIETPPPAPPREPRAPAVAPAPRAVEPPAQPQPAAPTDWASVTEYTVRPGDTLWEIAERVRTERGMTLEQVILAIFRNNPDAFHLDNVNYMFAGKVLQMPEREEVESVGATAARREFRAQYAAWREYKTQLAARSRTLTVAERDVPADAAPGPGATAETAEAPESAEAADTAEASEAQPDPETETAKADAPDAQAGESSGELLRIVRGSDAEAAGDGGAESESVDPESREQAALADRVTTLEESLASQQLEHRELSEKVGQVRSQIDNEKRLIEIENEALARQSAKAPQEAPAQAPRPAEESARPKHAPDAAARTRSAPPPKPAPKAAPPQPAQGLIATLVDDLLNNPYLPMIGGAVVVVAGLILFVYVRRRRRSIAEFEESILAADGAVTDGVATTETSVQPSAADTSFLSDFSKSGMGQMHTDEVDPIAEAEVYLAYGRDETAEEILKEAIVKNPERHELKQKLLEIYHQRNDAHAFETLAEELYAALGGPGGKIWGKVEEMGRRLNPDNPMFRGGGGGQQPRAAAPAAPAPVAPLVDDDLAATVAFDATPAPEQAPAPADDSLSFDQPVDSSLSVEAPKDEGLALDASGDDTGSIDFSFDEPSPEAPAEEPPAAEVSGADAGLDFDLSTEPLSDDDAARAEPSAEAAPGESLEALDLGSPADNLIDFESARQEAGAHAAADADSADAGAAGDEEIKWEMDMPVEDAATAETAETEGADDEGNGSWDETATKLDLAKAYIDMGDAEGARNILEEVMAEGNEEQKQQAAELAAQIA